MAIVYRERLHPRDRLGRFRETLTFDIPAGAGFAEIDENAARSMSGRWADSLSPEQLSGVVEYKDDAKSAADTNDFMRRGRPRSLPSAATEVPRHTREQARNLSGSLSQARVPANLTVYRGFHDDEIQEMYLQGTLVGSRLEDDGFMSTTISPERLSGAVPGARPLDAGTETGQPPISPLRDPQEKLRTVATIRVPEGAHGAYMGALGPDEDKELLLSDGATLQITGAEVRDDANGEPYLAVSADLAEQLGPPAGTPGGAREDIAAQAPRGPGQEEPSAGGKLITSNPDAALVALYQGREVELQQPEQVATLIDRLGEEVEKAKRRGRKAPDIDLCKLSVQGTNLFCAKSRGIPRLQMPQLSSEHPEPGSRADDLPRSLVTNNVDIKPQFLDSLRDEGVRFTEEEVRPDFLKASQSELNGAKVGKIKELLDSGIELEGGPLVVSRDNYIVDGHHRWAGITARDLEDNIPGNFTIPVIRVNEDIITLLGQANDFADEWGIGSEGANQGWAGEPLQDSDAEEFHPASPTFDDANPQQRAPDLGIGAFRQVAPSQAQDVLPGLEVAGPEQPSRQPLREPDVVEGDTGVWLRESGPPTPEALTDKNFAILPSGEVRVGTESPEMLASDVGYSSRAAILGGGFVSVEDGEVGVNMMWLSNHGFPSTEQLRRADEIGAQYTPDNAFDETETYSGEIHQPADLLSGQPLINGNPIPEVSELDGTQFVITPDGAVLISSERFPREIADQAGLAEGDTVAGAATLDPATGQRYASMTAPPGFSDMTPEQRRMHDAILAQYPLENTSSDFGEGEVPWEPDVERPDPGQALGVEEQAEVGGELQILPPSDSERVGAAMIEGNEDGWLHDEPIPGVVNKFVAFDDGFFRGDYYFNPEADHNTNDDDTKVNPSNQYATIHMQAVNDLYDSDLFDADNPGDATWVDGIVNLASDGHTFNEYDTKPHEFDAVDMVRLGNVIPTEVLQKLQDADPDLQYNDQNSIFAQKKFREKRGVAASAPPQRPTPKPGRIEQFIGAPPSVSDLHTKRFIITPDGDVIVGPEEMGYDELVERSGQDGDAPLVWGAGVDVDGEMTAHIRRPRSGAAPTTAQIEKANLIADQYSEGWIEDEISAPGEMRSIADNEPPPGPEDLTDHNFVILPNGTTIIGDVPIERLASENDFDVRTVVAGRGRFSTVDEDRVVDLAMRDDNTYPSVPQLRVARSIEGNYPEGMAFNDLPQDSPIRQPEDLVQQSVNGNPVPAPEELASGPHDATYFVITPEGQVFISEASMTYTQLANRTGQDPAQTVDGLGINIAGERSVTLLRPDSMDEPTQAQKDMSAAIAGHFDEGQVEDKVNQPGAEEGPTGQGELIDPDSPAPIPDEIGTRSFIIEPDGTVVIGRVGESDTDIVDRRGLLDEQVVVGKGMWEWDGKRVRIVPAFGNSSPTPEQVAKTREIAEGYGADHSDIRVPGGEPVPPPEPQEPFIGSVDISPKSPNTPELADLEAVEEYRDSSRWLNFKDEVEQKTEDYGLAVEASISSTGVYQGTVEPSLHLIVRDGEEDVRQFSADMAREFGQESALDFDTSETGPDMLWTFPVDLSGTDEIGLSRQQQAIDILAQNGLVGGTINENGVQVVDPGTEHTDALSRAEGDYKDQLGMEGFARIDAGTANFVGALAEGEEQPERGPVVREDPEPVPSPEAEPEGVDAGPVQETIFDRPGRVHVKDRVRLDPGLANSEQIRRALEDIERLHDIPEQARPVVVKNTLPMDEAEGVTVPPGMDYGEGESYDPSLDQPFVIRVNPQAHQPGLTFAHEFGHYLDMNMFGDPNTSGSGLGDMAVGTNGEGRAPELVAPVMDAIDSSGKVADLQKRNRRQKRHNMFAQLAGSWFDYALRDEETFARAYSEWVANRTDDRALKDEYISINHSDDPETKKNFRLQFWRHNDFKPIQAAFDDAFRTDMDDPTRFQHGRRGRRGQRRGDQPLSGGARGAELIAERQGEASGATATDTPEVLAPTRFFAESMDQLRNIGPDTNASAREVLIGDVIYQDGEPLAVVAVEEIGSGAIVRAVDSTGTVLTIPMGLEDSVEATHGSALSAAMQREIGQLHQRWLNAQPSRPT